MRQRHAHPLVACATVEEANREAANILAAWPDKSRITGSR
jgi:hypothetical protein